MVATMSCFVAEQMSDETRSCVNGRECVAQINTFVTQFRSFACIARLGSRLGCERHTRSNACWYREVRWRLEERKVEPSVNVCWQSSCGLSHERTIRSCVNQLTTNLRTITLICLPHLVTLM